MNAAEHAGIRKKQGWTVQLELDCSLLRISLNKHLTTLKNIKIIKKILSNPANAYK